MSRDFMDVYIGVDTVTLEYRAKDFDISFTAF